MVTSEQDLIKKLAEAEKELGDARRALADARRRWTDAESEVIGTKLNRDRIKEELRVHRNTTPRYEPDSSDLEIARFRQAHPELIEWIRKRDGIDNDD